MNTEQLQITNAQFTGASIILSVRNTGTTNITISAATVNADNVATISGSQISANSPGTVTLTYDTLSGNSYQVRLLSAKGTWFPYNAVAP